MSMEKDSSPARVIAHTVAVELTAAELAAISGGQFTGPDGNGGDVDDITHNARSNYDPGNS